MGIFQTYVLEIFVTHVRSKMVGKPYESCFINFFHLWIQLISEKGGGGGVVFVNNKIQSGLLSLLHFQIMVYLHFSNPRFPTR